MSEDAGSYRLDISPSATISTRSAEKIVASATTFLVVMILVGIHTGVAIMKDGELVVPFIVSFIAAIGIIVIHAGAIKAEVLQWFVRFIFVVVALATITSALDGDFSGHIRASAFFIYNVLIGYATFLGFSMMGLRRIETTFFWFAIVLVVGAGLEIYGPIRPLSDWFRDTFDKWHSTIYGNDFRDMANYGAVRPKFFASEPSVLGMSTAFCLAFWVCARRRPDFRFLVQAVCLLGAALFFVRSPTILAAPVAYLLVRVATSKPTNKREKYLRLLVPTFYMIIIAVMPLLALYAVFEFKDTPRYMLTTSFFERAIAPFLVVIRVLIGYPLWGIGLGHDDALTALVLKVFREVGALTLVPRAAMATIGSDICNAFWEFWIVFGVVGGAIMLWMFSRFLRILRVPVSPIVVFCIVSGTFWQGFGSVNMPVAWFSIFSIAALCSLLWENDKAASV